MDYQHYVDKANAASKMFDEEDLQGAAALFEELIHSDISDIDKSMMAYNMARVYEKAEQPDRALAWYDYGIALEEPHCRSLILEHKAVFLINQKRSAEAIAIYELLYTLPHVTEGEKQRFANNIEVLRNPSA